MEVVFQQKNKGGEVMNINLSVKTHIAVNVKKRTVTAIAEFEGSELFRVAVRYMNNVITPPKNQFSGADHLCLLFAKPSRFFQDMMMPDYCSATAYCHPDDIFDLDKGKEIAEKRLAEKICKMIKRRMYKMGKEFVKYGNALCE